MKIPTLQEAERIVAEAELMNPGPWGDHCRVAAECARKIADKCETMNSDVAYILGLLHDIGRRFGVSHFGHVSDGYQYMNELGYEDAARICLSHSFQYQNIEAYMGNFDVSDEKRKDMEEKLMSLVYNDYDRLIQLCDCLAMASGVALIEQRIVDVVLRYGFSKYTVDKWKSIFKLKKYFEEKTGSNIYEVVSDDQTLWGK